MLISAYTRGLHSLCPALASTFHGATVENFKIQSYFKMKLSSNWQENVINNYIVYLLEKPRLSH